MNLTLTFILLIAVRRVDVGHLVLVCIQVIVMLLMTVVQVLHVNSWLKLHADHQMLRQHLKCFRRCSR